MYGHGHGRMYGHEGIHSDIVSSNRFDENSDISTTYLGRIEMKGVRIN